MCKQCGLLRYKDVAVAAQTRCVSSLCLPRMRHYVELSRTQASLEVVSRATHILRACVGGARKGKEEGENTYGVKGLVFVR